jgi:hypothetical protein
LKYKKSSRYLLFLSSLCSHKESGIPENQDLISELLFHEGEDFEEPNSLHLKEDVMETFPERRAGRARVTQYLQTIEMLSHFVGITKKSPTATRSTAAASVASSPVAVADGSKMKRRNSIEMSYAEVVSHTDEREHDWVDAAYEELMNGIQADEEKCSAKEDCARLALPVSERISSVDPSGSRGQSSSQQTGEGSDGCQSPVAASDNPNKALLRKVSNWPNVLLPVAYDAKRDALFVPSMWSVSCGGTLSEPEWIELSEWWETSGAALGELENGLPADESLRDYYSVSLQVFTVLCRARRKEPGNLVSPRFIAWGPYLTCCLSLPGSTPHFFRSHYVCLEKSSSTVRFKSCVC